MMNLILSLVMVLSLSSISAQAGEKIGNGGGAWACVIAQGSQKWVRQIDLYEGTTEYHLPIQERHTDFYVQAEAAVMKFSRVDDRLGRDYAFALMNVKAKARFVRAELELINDALFRIRPYSTECASGEIRYVQIANFKDSDHDDELIIREDIWNHPDFSQTERAALYLHEAIYADLRAKYGEETSTRARHLTAILLSDLEGAELKKEVDAVLDGTPNPTQATPMSFAKIPAGTYTVGKPGAERSLTITEPFEIMTTELTEFHQQKISPSSTGSGTQRLKCPTNFVVMRTQPYEMGYCPNLPILTRGDRALVTARRLTETDPNGYFYRIPTGDEWEIAARGRATTLFFFGSDGTNAEEFAILSSTRLERSQAMDVATKKPNAFGLYDTVGNLAEIATYHGRFGTGFELRGCSWADKLELYQGTSTCSETYTRNAEGGQFEVWGGVRFIREKR